MHNTKGNNIVSHEIIGSVSSLTIANTLIHLTLEMDILLLI